MKKGLKVFLTAAIVISAVACSTSNDEVKEKVVETKEDTSIPKENRNALHKAENYSKMMHMSKQRIYDQLTSENGEKFTAEQAQYAIDNIKGDYLEAALEAAKNYQETMSMSKDVIYDQLVSDYGEKFTAEEAQYAIDNLDD